MMICPHCHNPLSSDEADSLRSENAKLRELLADLWRDYRWATDDLEEPYSKQGEFADRMRELGIEVES